MKNTDFLVFEIYAVDKRNDEHKALIGKCFNKGLAKVWIESGVTQDNYILYNKDTGETCFYNSVEKKWN